MTYKPPGYAPREHIDADGYLQITEPIAAKTLIKSQFGELCGACWCRLEAARITKAGGDCHIRKGKRGLEIWAIPSATAMAEITEGELEKIMEAPEPDDLEKRLDTPGKVD